MAPPSRPDLRRVSQESSRPLTITRPHLKPWCPRQETAPWGGATSSPDGHGDHESGAPGAGTEPDPRFTLANERTFLAWNRTALALVVAGLGIVQLLPPFPGVPWGRHVLGVPLIVLGAGVAVTAYLEWRRTQAALQHGTPLPRSVLPQVLATTITGVAAVAAVVLLVSAVR